MSGSSPSAGGQAPESGQPQAGTPAPGAPTAVPGAPSIQAPQVGMNPSQPKYAFQSDAEMEAFIDRQIAARQRANHKEQEAKSELGALKQQLDQLLVQQRLSEQRAIEKDVLFQAKTLGFRNPALAYGVIARQMFDEQTGQYLNNATALLEALKASDSYLLEQVAPQPGTQPRTGVMNAPQSAAVPPGGGLTKEVIQANIRNQAWVAAHISDIEAFYADPLNHQ